ncbi:hypothetical protein RRG08_029908 [Elysia crispata]|uniref:EGF-like domain-containing protein n=1 Tax=Elysia crispata TaxID=231223 RepID=A0AAE1A870_9GAST|nr:hypothetical protein RRG08_029908 [Elysia crispata]
MYDIHKHLRQPSLSAPLFNDNRHSVTDLARILYLACSLIALRSEHTLSQLSQVEIPKCPTGFYGPDCINQCSVHCAVPYNPCRRDGGHGMLDCDSGFMGERCDIRCSSHWFGPHTTCHRYYATCEAGCGLGYMGAQCLSPSCINCGYHQATSAI